MRALEEVARELAAAHRKSDPKTKTIKFFPSLQGDEFRLLEVSDAAPTTGEVLPFRFPSDQANGIDYPSVVILLSPKEWLDIQAKKLPLPNGWDLPLSEDL
jgi:hypothetical protein